MDSNLNLEKNLKRYPLYKMFAWDLLFYYAIIFIFLLKVKNLSASQIFFADAFYPIFKFIFQFFCIGMTDIIGKRKSILFGNIFINIALILIILCKNINGLILANLLFAIGYNLKELCEAPLLNHSITNKEKRREIFSKIDGNASSKFYFFDAICSATSGFLFAFNYYLPMILCFTFSLFGTIIAFTFEEKENQKNIFNVSKHSIKNYFKDLHYVFKHIFKSKRLKSLILYAALFTSLLAVFKTYINSLLVDLHLPDIYFGLLTAAIQIISAFSSKNQNYFHKKYRNRVLTFFAIPLSILIIITGLFVVCNLPTNLICLVIAALIFFYALVKGPFYTLIKRYLNSFVSSSISTKIYAANSMCDSIFRSLTYLFSSYLLSLTTTSFALIILGSISTLIFIFLLDYMKTRVGLNPEKYSAADTQIGLK